MQQKDRNCNPGGVNSSCSKREGNRKWHVDDVIMCTACTQCAIHYIVGAGERVQLRDNEMKVNMKNGKTVEECID